MCWLSYLKMHFVWGETEQQLWRKRKDTRQRFRMVVCLLLFFFFLFVFSFELIFTHDSGNFQNLRPVLEWLACVLGLEIIVILRLSASNLCSAQTLVIAATSWPMLFEEIIMASDNEGKWAWLHPTEYFFFLTVFPVCESSYWRLHRTIISVSVSSGAMSSFGSGSSIVRWIIIGWKMFWVSAWVLDCGNVQLVWG